MESTENVTAVDIDLICLLFPHPTQISFVVILDASKVFELISPSRHHDDETFENRSSARKIPQLFNGKKLPKISNKIFKITEKVSFNVASEAS